MMETPVDQLKSAMEKITAMSAEVETIKADAASKAEQVKALTAERDTLKARADEAVAKVAALEKAQADVQSSLTDLTAKLQTAEQKLKDPAFLAASAQEMTRPVEGMGAGAGAPGIKPVAERIREVESKLKTETDGRERARLRNEHVALIKEMEG